MESLCLRTIGLRVSPWKFDVSLETSLLRQTVCFKNIKFPRGNYQTDSSSTETLYCFNRNTKIMFSTSFGKNRDEKRKQLVSLIIQIFKDRAFRLIYQNVLRYKCETRLVKCEIVHAANHELEKKVTTVASL